MEPEQSMVGLETVGQHAALVCREVAMGEVQMFQHDIVPECLTNRFHGQRRLALPCLRFSLDVHTFRMDFVVVVTICDAL